jgi:cystathionine gamma-synthase
VHAGEVRWKPYHALVDPIFQTSTYTFEKMAEVIEYEESHKQGQPIDRFEYGRYGNPTVAAAEARLAALEHAESAIQVASGMAAISYALLHLLPAGSHVVMTDDSYRRTRQFCETYLKRFNVDCTVVPFGDEEALGPPFALKPGCSFPKRHPTPTCASWTWNGLRKSANSTGQSP